MKTRISLSPLPAVIALFCLFLLPATGAVADETRMLADELTNAPGRSDEDKARDEKRRPDQVLTFLGLRSGDTVLDIWAAGGWYSEVLSIAVGPEGKVFSQNAPSVLQFRDGVHDKALTARLSDARLPNVTRLDDAMVDTSISPSSVDFAITALNFHDIYNRNGSDAAAKFLEAVFDVLKPGGTFGIIDHVGTADADNAALHRIDPSLVKKAAMDAGYIVEAESDLLAHSEDDHSKKVFDPTLRGDTDRFVLRLRKPE
jgi:predicted methyltransferase